MELRLCPTRNDFVEVTQECLNENLLFIEGYGYQYPVDENIDQIYFRLRKTKSLVKHCDSVLFSERNYRSIYRVLDAFYSGDITQEIIGEKISKQVNRVWVVDLKKNFTSKTSSIRRREEKNISKSSIFFVFPSVVPM